MACGKQLSVDKPRPGHDDLERRWPSVPAPPPMTRTKKRSTGYAAETRMDGKLILWVCWIPPVNLAAFTGTE